MLQRAMLERGDVCEQIVTWCECTLVSCRSGAFAWAGPGCQDPERRAETRRTCGELRDADVDVNAQDTERKATVRGLVRGGMPSVPDCSAARRR